MSIKRIVSSFGSGYFNNRNQGAYTAVAHNTPAPYGWTDVEPGSVIVTEWNGLAARWINGTIYVSTYAYEQWKKQNQRG